VVLQLPAVLLTEDPPPAFSLDYFDSKVPRRLMEENAYCKFWGRVGLIRDWDERKRWWVLHIGFAANLVGFVLTLYSCLAISDNHDVLHLAAFSSGVLSDPDFEDITRVTLYLGLRAASVDLVRGGPTVVTFDEFCDLPTESLARYMDDSEETCGACHEVSTSMGLTVILSCVTFLPSFFTDVLRMYSNYDVNCQKGFATLFATVTLLLSLNTLIKYNRNCFAAFYAGIVPFNEKFEAVEDATTAAYQVDFDWSMGPGLICLYVGTVLKAVDIACNIIVPSPQIAQDIKKQWEYERLGEGENKEAEEEIQEEEEEIEEAEEEEAEEEIQEEEIQEEKIQEEKIQEEKIQEEKIQEAEDEEEEEEIEARPPSVARLRSSERMPPQSSHHTHERKISRTKSDQLPRSEHHQAHQVLSRSSRRSQERQVARTKLDSCDRQRSGGGKLERKKSSEKLSRMEPDGGLSRSNYERRTRRAAPAGRKLERKKSSEKLSRMEPDGGLSRSNYERRTKRAASDERKLERKKSSEKLSRMEPERGLSRSNSERRTKRAASAERVLKRAHSGDELKRVDRYD
jgi:hypothetical protein